MLWVVSFSTGALLSGEFLSGGTFSDVGSSFVVIGKGSQVPHKGLIFQWFVRPDDFLDLGRTKGAESYLSA